MNEYNNFNQENNEPVIDVTDFKEEVVIDLSGGYSEKKKACLY